MNNKKLFLIPMFLILGSGIIFAAWAFSYNNTIQATIFQGGGVLLVVEDISDFSLNPNESVQSNNQSLSLFNKNGFKETTFNFTVNKTLTELSCPDYQNDCSVKFWNRSNNVIGDGTPLWLFSGWNNHTIETICVQNSCGQDISIEVNIQ